MKRRVVFGLVALGGGWAVLWGVDSYWNPIAFVGLWTGATLLMWSFSHGGYPGMARHLRLALLSLPVWWWFELMNARLRNWEYLTSYDYGPTAHALLSSLAFATVVPALTAASSLAERLVRPAQPSPRSPQPRLARTLILVGVVLQAAVLAFPTQLYLFVWVAPLLVLDGLLAARGERSLVSDLVAGHWREAALLASGGLICGVLWEFWNVQATPKWVYHLLLLGFGKVFEMPVLGYLGYVPFAWSVAQLVRWLELLGRHTSSRPSSAATAETARGAAHRSDRPHCRAATPPGATWKRCRTHDLRNLPTQLPKSAHGLVATLVRSIFAQPSPEEVPA